MGSDPVSSYTWTDIGGVCGETTRGHSKKAAIFKPRREALEKINLLTPSPWTYSLQRCEKIGFCGLRDPVQEILLWES